MSAAPPPTLRLRVDRGALAHNWRALDRLSGTARAGAAVKANCYGLGAEHCVPVLRDAGCRDYFVAHWSEVAGVAAHVSPDQIAVLHGPGSTDDCEYAKAVGAVPVINSIRQAELWHASGGGTCHLMVNTGINRLGIRPEEAVHPAIQQLDVAVVMSHLADADADSAMNAQQRAAFDGVRGQIAHREASLANSAGIGLGQDYQFDLTRPGLALYGGVPRPELADLIRQVAYPQAAIIQTRQIAAGETVGYNATFRAPQAMRIGVVSLGYADGILRAWGGAALEHEGRRLPILGKVSMDMIVLDFSAAPDIGEGDWLDLPYRLPGAAQQTGLSQYELLTILGRRFSRD